MDYPNQPDAPGGRYVDNGTNGQEGTIVRAEALNALHDEIIGVIAASGQTPDSADVSQLLTAIGALGGGGGGLTNWILNGTLNIWQRGNSFDTVPTPDYTADRWEVQSDGPNGAGRGRLTRVEGGVQPGVIDGMWTFMRYEPLVAADTGGPQIRTKLETLRDLSDRRNTFSFLARAETAIDVNVQVLMVINNTTTVITTVQVAVGQSWGRHSVSFDIANLAGQNVATDGSDYLQLEIRLPNLDSNTVDLARLQLEEGAAPTTFEQRDQSLEYFLCRRYYRTSLDLGELPGSGNLSRIALVASSGTAERFMAHRFSPPMRIPPTITFYNGANAGQVFWPGTSGNVGGTLAIFRSRVALSPPVMVGGGPTTESLAQFNYTAEAEI